MQLIQPVKQSHPLKPAAGKRLLLVDPYPRNNPYRLTASERRAVWFPKLSLPTIAAYTPENWEVDLVDEAVQDIDFDYPCDMVGLSIMTCYAPRAYEIANGISQAGQDDGHGGRSSHLLSRRSSSVCRCDRLWRSRRSLAAIGRGL